MNIETVIICIAIGYLIGAAHATRNVYVSESQIVYGKQDERAE